MRKAAIQLLITVMGVAGIWLLFSQYDYIDYFERNEYNKIPENLEQELGDLFKKQILRDHRQLGPDSLTAVVNHIYHHICESNDIDPESMNLYVIKSDQVNAFVIPGKHIFIFSGLLEYVENAEELGGVIAHEIAHIQEDHVSKRLAREVGMAMVMAVIGMDTGSEAVLSILRLFVSSSYNRSEEQDADRKGAGYMVNAGVDPIHLANVMLRFASETPAAMDRLEWVMSHPNPRRRSTDILNWREEFEFDEKPLYEGNWKELTAEWLQ